MANFRYIILAAAAGFALIQSGYAVMESRAVRSENQALTAQVTSQARQLAEMDTRLRSALDAAVNAYGNEQGHYEGINTRVSTLEDGMKGPEGLARRVQKAEDKARTIEAAVKTAAEVNYGQQTDLGYVNNEIRSLAEKVDKRLRELHSALEGKADKPAEDTAVSEGR